MGMKTIRNTVILIVLFLGVYLEGSAQKSFIGQTKAQVREYWSLHISDEYFSEGTYDDGQDYFDIMRGNFGVPDFTATFDKSGKCVSQDLKIESDEVSVYIARIKKLGYTYNAKSKQWEKPGSSTVWVFENFTGVDVLTARKK